MRRITGTMLMALVLVAASMAITSSAEAGRSRTHVVRAGQSIQAAIDAARPGDTIYVKRGVYAEALVITKDDLTLKGSRGTVLVMPESADNVCTEVTGGLVVGICVLGEINFETFEVIEPLEDPRISGFTIKGFTDSGIVAIGTDDLRVTHTTAKNNAGYGIFALLSTEPTLAHNKASGNGDAGLYVGSSQESEAEVYGNTSWNNLMGIFLRDVSEGEAERNKVFGNCAGIVLLADSPGPVTDWEIERNLVKANNKTECGEEDPLPSGTGILLLGASDNEVERNLVIGNRGAEGGGIVLAGGASDNSVKKNVAFRNRPFDVLWDGTGTDNRFRDNRCRTSQPAFICD
jgi:parallel beta-helix repeat protein